MKHSDLSRCLKAAGIAACIGLTLAFFVAAPVAGRSLCEIAPDRAFLFWPVLIWLWGIFALYISCMVSYLKICRRIGEDKSFVWENAVCLKSIGKRMWISSVMWLALFAVMRHPGLWLFLLLMATASAAMGVLSWVIGELVRKAAALQEEHDLTV